MNQKIANVIQSLINNEIIKEKELFSLFRNFKLLENTIKEKTTNVTFPKTIDFKRVYNHINETAFFQQQRTSPSIFLNFIQNIKSEHSNDDDIDIFEGLMEFDGWQNYKEESIEKKETSTVGMGAFDAMFVGFQNEKISEENKKDKSFGIIEEDLCTYVKFKTGEIKELMFLDSQNKFMLSSVNHSDYTRFNFLSWKDENQIIQIFASQNTTLNKSQMTFYILDSQGRIIDDDTYTVGQFIHYPETGSLFKYIKFYNDYITDFNSKTYSYDKQQFVFKGIATILMPKYNNNLFKEYNIKGFEFPLIKDYEISNIIRTNKIKEDLDFQIKKEGKKSYGIRTNQLNKDLRQSNVCLLEEFTNIERDRLLFNKKPKINIPDFDQVDFSKSIPLEKLLSGNYFKMQALDAIDIYSSNISPFFGKSLFDNETFVSVIEKDFDIEEFIKYKTKLINENQNTSIKYPFTENTLLTDYIFSIREIDIINEQQQYQPLLGELILCHKDKKDSLYKNEYTNKELDQFLREHFALNDLRKESYIFDHRVIYKDYLRKILKQLGAKESDINLFDNKIEYNVTENLLAYQDITDNKVKEQLPDTLSVITIVLTDKRYYNINKSFEDFANIKVLKCFEEILSSIPDIKDVIKDLKVDVETNIVSFVFEKEKEDEVLNILNKFKKISKEI